MRYFVFMLILFLSSCGEETHSGFTPTPDEVGGGVDESLLPVQTQREAEPRELIPIPVSVQRGADALALTLDTTVSSYFSFDPLSEELQVDEFWDSPSLGLVAADAATSYKLSIANCLSGYSQTDITASTVNVYQFDASCTAQLTEIVFDGVTYDLTHADAVAWSGTAVGSTATMVDTNATAGASNSTEREQLVVIIDTTFSATVNAADTLTFTFRQKVQGATETLNVNIVANAGHTVGVTGNEAPNFTIETVTLKSLDVTDGFGVWEIKMLCASELVSSNTECEDVLLTDIKYTLIHDTFGGSEPTRANLLDAINGAGLYTLSAAIAVIAGDVNNAVASTYNGGFSTLGSGGNTYVSPTNTIKGSIHALPNLIFILGVGASDSQMSIQYFHMDVTVVSN